jgi:hypothetical protein
MVLVGQDSQERSARTGQSRQDCHDMTAKIGARMGLKGHNRLDKTARIRLPGQDSQDTTPGTRLSGKDRNDRKDGQEKKFAQLLKIHEILAHRLLKKNLS